MPTKTLKKPVKDGAYIVEWAKFSRKGNKSILREWILDVGKIEGDWFYSSDGHTKKKVSSDYFLIKRRIKSEVLKMPPRVKKSKKQDLKQTIKWL